ncbi:Uncharacterized 37.6 kDa protein in cld 5'region [Seminavis robusta]|uniref:Uncharacterized 37.6 kDa protein in cld 5'region n=1 Tax=Seminavis robusta TaxID=568900 RepID=A0A9N8E0Y9_9STRA|nr:Uncharacterized 37.6 kDa protein in cld 5'region [Seminavis robusta]|eukprot:Sro539_g162730.1 Uncharacterized 37.6 kDa protein in cld 5'region (499) ;mRNA; f:2972-4468
MMMTPLSPTSSQVRSYKMACLCFVASALFLTFLSQRSLGRFQDFLLDESQNQEHQMMRHRRAIATDSTSADDINTQTTTPVPPDTSHKTVLVTGGAGFIGSHVAQALLQRGDDVVIIDNMNDYYPVHIKENNLHILKTTSAAQQRQNATTTSSRRLTIYRGDICNQTLLDQIFRETRPSHICHLAARAGVRPSVEDPFLYVQTNIMGTTRLLEMAVQYNVSNFVYASSSSVYGGSSSSSSSRNNNNNNNRTTFSETQQLDRPWSPYAATKKSTELMAATYHHLYNLHSTGLRFFTVYGPRGRPDMAPYKFVDRVSRGLPIPQYGDGTAVRDFTYIDDIVQGILQSLDRAYPCQVFNLGRGEGIVLKDFIQLVERFTNKQATIQVLPTQTGDVPYTMADTSKARALLGYLPKVSFDEGIRRTVEWYNRTHLGRPKQQQLQDTLPKTSRRRQLDGTNGQDTEPKQKSVKPALRKPDAVVRLQRPSLEDYQYTLSGDDPPP